MKASSIAFGGILTAVSLILLYLTRLLPTNTLTLLALLSFIPPIALMEKGLKTAILVYICSSMGSLLFASPHISLLYILFFGMYGIIKGFIERINKSFVEIVLKLVVFNMTFLITFFLAQGILGIDLETIFATLLSRLASLGLHSTSSFVFIYLLLQPAFLIFDYALTLLVGYYDDYIKKYIKRGLIK
ncbi:hypothetical protein CS063_14270 [Sporanaerobium hydrogeniformans]|uniref:Uncharacterized protein n=1 Tax=Sporanaerobium hydrogeniformans TaxID=3072179 RepID=A0AC61DAP3_9FIRM|nr:hypothetical protein [Sporanaerobium hydrogeniformans]PHV69756.1 hypothetical protein CS063_14270 [Sporanaerobium hydrogeniformans]